MRLQESFACQIYWPLAQKLKREHAAKALKKLSDSQWKSRDELLTSQWRLTRETVNNAIRDVPYYKQLFTNIGWDFNNREFSYRDFLKIPKLEKETLRDHIFELLNPNYQDRVTKGMTSGSTGQSLFLYYTSEHESYSEAARWRAKKWWGIKPGSPHVSLWGRPYSGYKDRLKQRLKSYLMNNLLFSAFDLTEEALENMWKKIFKFRPSIIYGYPSAIYPLSIYIKENRKPVDRLDLKVIMTTAESITIQQRRLIENVFKCKTANEYGCSETGGFVYECPSGSWHISSELTFIEFLDQDGNPVPSGKTGEIFLTHLKNNYMPLIRYRVGDIGTPLAENCQCGRSLPRMEVSVAKESDHVQLSDGKCYSSEIFDYINLAVLNKFPASILQFKIIQRAFDLFDIEIIPGDGLVDNAETLFKNLIKKQLGENIKINVNRVSQIKRETSGKLRYFISDMNLSKSL
jgi:phenylacetate-CoA ligase